MRLLVSVRSAAEVPPAVAGGADILDAKEPSHGSLGAVSAAVLREISGCLPPSAPLSIALGDPRDASALEAAMAVLDGLGPRPGPVYMKIGLSAAGSGAEAVLRAGVDGAARLALGPLVIAVGYADHARAGAPSPEVVTRLALAAGAHGVLLDTWGKGDGDLFHHMEASGVQAWVEDGRTGGLLVALAGSLTVAGVRTVAGLAAPADIVGVRGAACAGGRGGIVAEDRVAALKAAIARVAAPPACAT